MEERNLFEFKIRTRNILSFPLLMCRGRRQTMQFSRFERELISARVSGLRCFSHISLKYRCAPIKYTNSQVRNPGNWNECSLRKKQGCFADFCNALCVIIVTTTVAGRSCVISGAWKFCFCISLVFAWIWFKDAPSKYVRTAAGNEAENLRHFCIHFFPPRNSDEGVSAKVSFLRQIQSLRWVYESFFNFQLRL